VTAEKAGMLAGCRVLDLTTGGSLVCGRLLSAVQIAELEAQGVLD
jgi:hypothetical protein